MQNFALEGKITVFKALAMSKMVHLALLTIIPTSIMKELNKTQKEFIWNYKNPKIKHNSYVRTMIIAA